MVIVPLGSDDGRVRGLEEILTNVSNINRTDSAAIVRADSRTPSSHGVEAEVHRPTTYYRPGQSANLDTDNIYAE